MFRRAPGEHWAARKYGWCCLTRRCSGLASLAAELHIVRPLIRRTARTTSCAQPTISYDLPAHRKRGKRYLLLLRSVLPRLGVLLPRFRLVPHGGPSGSVIPSVAKCAASRQEGSSAPANAFAPASRLLPRRPCSGFCHRGRGAFSAAKRHPPRVPPSFPTLGRQASRQRSPHHFPFRSHGPSLSPPVQSSGQASNSRRCAEAA